MLRLLIAGSGAAILGPLACSVPNKNALPATPEYWTWDLTDASNAVRSGTVSPVELTKACLERIAQVDGKINSYITVAADQALAQARDAEAAIAKGNWLGPLHGIPIAVKDNVDTAGIRTTAASAVFADRVPEKDAAVIAKLKAEGAVIMGKLNMHEFALGTTSAISHFGPVRNPWSLDHVAGGSSGGSGAAVAAGLCFGAVGTDTGGSIRIPASCCGIVGLKPTYDVVSSEGTVLISRTFDHVGPLCRTVVDTALLFSAMTDHPIAKAFDPMVAHSVSKMKLGIVDTSGGVCDSAVEPDVQAAFDRAVSVLTQLGAATQPATLPMPDLGGIIDHESFEYHSQTLATSGSLYDARTRKIIETGGNKPRAEYERLLGEIARYRASIGQAFAGIDAMILPTMPVLPIPLKDATEPFSLDACTFGFSIAGVPAISVPCGFSESGLPIGLMIAGPPLSEPKLLAIAAAYEKAAGWDRRRPVL